MRTIQQWVRRWQDRRIVRARLDQIQREREQAEAWTELVRRLRAA